MILPNPIPHTRGEFIPPATAENVDTVVAASGKRLGCEIVQVDGGWEFRPRLVAARRTAYIHAGCLTLPLAWFGLVLVLGPAFIAGDLLTTAFGLPRDRSHIVAGIMTAVAVTPALWLVARYVFRKSLRDNWLFLRVNPGGPVLYGGKVLVEAGQIRGVRVRTETISDDEVELTQHVVEIVPPRDYATPVIVPVPIPILGCFIVLPTSDPVAIDFAQAMAVLLGVPYSHSTGPA